MSGLRIGTAQVDITPSGICDLSGFAARTQPATGLHDRVFATALVAQSERKQVVLVSCDLLSFSPGFVAKMRQQIGDKTHILNSLLATTHTHSAPASIRLWHCGEADPEWMEDLSEKLVAVVGEAADRLEPVEWGFGKIDCEVAMNRRVREGERMGHLSFAEPGLTGLGLIDPAVSVMAFRNAQGIKATMVNYACHPVCLGHENRLISSDYPGEMRRFLQRQGVEAVLFTNGASADINPRVPRRSFEESERVGREIGNAAMEAISDMAFSPEAQVDFQEEETAFGHMDGSEVKVVISALKIGPVLFASMPGEVFVKIGLQIKRLFPNLHVVPVGYGNGCVGYIPTEVAYEEGGYEVDDAWKYYGYPSAVDPATGRQLVTTIRRLGKELHVG